MVKKGIKMILIVLVLVLMFNILEPSFRKTTDSDWLADVMRRWNSEGKKERIKCIDDNQEALLWRLRMIESAKEEIILATFDLRADESGKDVMSALYDAAERGVKIKILVDGIYEIPFLKRSKEFKTLSAHENVEAGMYNPIRLKNSLRFNYRMHDKYLIIDKEMYMLGGRNTNDIFLGEYQKWINIDRDIFVCGGKNEEGFSIHQLLAYFDTVWAESCVDKKISHVSEKDAKEQKEMFVSRYQALKETYPDIEEYDGWVEETIEANKVQLIANETHAARKEPRVLDAIEEFAADQKEILIQTPYVICDSYMYDTLRKTGEKADLKIILNAVEKGSNPWGCTDYMNNKEKILETGADVYELMNEQAVHTKTILLGDQISVVGSFNLDMRSAYIDTELMLVIDSEELNSHIRSMDEEYMKKSKEVLSSGEETEGELYAKKELSAGKSFFYQALRILIRPFRHLL